MKIRVCTFQENKSVKTLIGAEVLMDFLTKLILHVSFVEVNSSDTSRCWMLYDIYAKTHHVINASGVSVPGENTTDSF